MAAAFRFPRKSRLLLLSTWIAVLLNRGGTAQSSSGSFEPLGIRGDRAYFSQLPFESVDMVTGNLNLSFTDLVLPGNAGMNVTIVRSMNFGGGATGPSWSVGPAGLPIALFGASAPAAGPWYVGVVMADGGRRAVPHQSGVDTYVLDNFMRVTLSSRTVELPNGWIATYETGTGLIEAELQEVHDPYGNSITAYWLSRPGGAPTLATKINRLELRGGNEGVRTVYINYDATGARAESLQSEGRTWSYSYTDGNLTSVAPPAGPPRTTRRCASCRRPG